ncbi:hypothetical protein [Rathayibacter rathayi]|uniref:hypothetical protein n=1 Tax=Rathayibacter rathayi TaxID=33887 RepID=UPI0011B090EB|nr:hypothetical protein [Rathayibacter rathayi]
MINQNATKLDDETWPDEPGDVEPLFQSALFATHRANQASRDLRALLTAYAHQFHQPRPVMAELARAQDASPAGLLRRYNQKHVDAISSLLSSTPDLQIIQAGFPSLSTAELSQFTSDVDETTNLSAPAADIEVPASKRPELAPRVAISAAEAAQAEQPADTTEEPLDLPDPTAPIIRILGRIRIDGAKGLEPRNATTTYVTPATELLVFLALNPHATGEQVSEALWPGKASPPENRNQLMSRTRRWLGVSETGAEYLPPVTTGVYGLHETVTSDWAIWKNLIGDNLKSTPTRNLVAAMKLVHGRPFDGTPRRRYAWADSFRQEITASIVDAAHELAERSLATRDVAAARLAAIARKKADPTSEIPDRDQHR